MPSLDSSSALILEPPKKIFYIDRIKVLLTILVILHHTFITYGAPGGWYYTQKSTQIGALIPMTMFVAINQAFFMGFFFFLSSYFIPTSYSKKGALKFITDRMLRLGVPLIFYSLVFSPILTYLVYYFGLGRHITFLQYLGGFNDWIDFGVLWFVAALLVFTSFYVAIHKLFSNYRSKQLHVPSTGAIILFAISIGFLSFFVRLVYPVGWILKPVGFQFGHFSQYIALFILGIIAAKNDWLTKITYQTGKKMAWITVLLILFFPVFYVIKLKFNIPLDWYSGGFHWSSLLYAIWEQLIGFSIVTALLAFGKKFWNHSSPTLVRLSRYSFAVYIFHPLLIVSLALVLKNWMVEPALKLLIVAPLAIISSFLLASVIVAIPRLAKII